MSLKAAEEVPAGVYSVAVCDEELVSVSTIKHFLPFLVRSNCLHFSTAVFLSTSRQTPFLTTNLGGVRRCVCADEFKKPSAFPWLS